MSRSGCYAFITLFAAALLLAAAPMARAISAAPFAFDEVQPDGEPVELYIRGDEAFNWLEDRDGYTVMRHLG